MAFNPCPGCSSPQAKPVFNADTLQRPAATAPTGPIGPVTDFDVPAVQGDIVDAGQDLQMVEDGDGSDEYVVTWDRPDTSKEKIGLLLAGGLAFLAPFVGFAVAARVARGSKGYFKPIGAGALTFFAMRAAAVGALHFSDNLPTVTAPAAFGAMMPQVPQRRVYSAPQVPQAPAFGHAPCRGCR